MLTPHNGLTSFQASFGRPLPEDGVHGRAVMAVPKDGCSKIAPPPQVDPDDPDYRSRTFSFIFEDDDDGDLFAPKKLGWIVLISRYGGCTFEDKVTKAQGLELTWLCLPTCNDVLPLWKLEYLYLHGIDVKEMKKSLMYWA